MLWTVNLSEVDMVMVIMEDVATVAKDVKVAVMTNLQPLTGLTFQTLAIHLQGRSGKCWEMGAALFNSYMNVIKVLATDGDPPVMGAVAEAITTLNVVSLHLRQMMQTQQQILPLPPVTTMTVVDIMDAGLVKGPMVKAALDSLGR